MLPSIENLRCFLAAARLLRFRTAARTVALTPAAFGQRIRQLEEEMGTPLFERTTRQVQLTDTGLRLIPHAEACLRAAEACLSAGRGDSGSPPMELTLGTRHELGLSWVLPGLGEVRRAHPNLTVHLYFGSGADLFLRLKSLEIDVAITSTRLAEPTLDSVTLHREDYALVASTALLAAQPFTRVADAPRHTLIDISEELPLFEYWRDGAGGRRTLAFGAVWKLGTIAAIRREVLAGAGVAVLPEYLIRGDLARRRLRRVLPAVRARPDNFRLVFRRRDPRRPVFEALAATFAARPLR